MWILLDGRLEGVKNSSGEAVVQPLNDRKMSIMSGLVLKQMVSLVNHFFTGFPPLQKMLGYKFVEWSDTDNFACQRREENPLPR